MNRIILEGILDMNGEAPKLKLDNRDLWNILDEYYLDGSIIKVTIEEIQE